MRTLRWTIRLAAASVLLVSVAWLWLLHTTSGARFVMARAESATGLTVEEVAGSIARGLVLQGARFVNDRVVVTIEEASAAIDITLLPLSVGIDDADARRIRVTIADDGATAEGKGGAPVVLEGLVLPFPLRVDALRVTDIVVSTGDREQVIDALELSVTWHDDIHVSHMAVSTAELDAGGEAMIALRGGNAISSDLHASLKPALTRLKKAVAIRVQAEGDLDGADVLASVDSSASIDGRVRWQGGLEAEAEVTLDALELAGLVENWPQGFPIDGKLHAMVNDSEFELRDSRLEIGGTDLRILVDSRMQRDSGRIEGRLQWEQLRWPLHEDDPRLRSKSADLQLRGTIDDWTVAGTIAVAVDDLPRGVFQIDGKGDRNGASGRIVDSEVLGGRISGEVAYTWRDPRPWLARLDLADVQLAWLFPDWPAVVTGRFDSRGTGDPFAMHAVLEGLEGQLRGQPLRADGVVDIADGNVVVDQLRVEHGGSSALLDGALMMPTGLRFDARVADLSVYVTTLGGEVTAQGTVSLADVGFLEATLASPSLSIGDLDLSGVDARVEASDGSQTLAASGTYLDTPIELSLSGALADWRQPLASRFEGRLDALDIDFGDKHSMTLSRPARVAFTLDEIDVEQLCLADATTERLCANLQWRQGGSYGAELALYDLPIDLIEHFADSPLIFDQRVSGRFNWQHTFGAGPRGNGQLTVSSGTIAAVDDPDSTVATGDGVLDFDIEQGRLLRGDIVLPFPGRGKVSGDFSVADVRLGAESGVAGNLDVDLSSIRALSKLTNLVDYASGALRARVNLAGVVAEPVWTGDLTLDDGAFSYGPLGLELTEVDLVGTMDPDYRFDVSGTFRAGRGAGEILSRADYSNADEPGLLFRIRGERLTLVNVPDVFVEADADVDIALDSETLSINGNVAVPNALIKPRKITETQVNESDDVVIVAGELPDPPEEEKKRSEIEYGGELNVSLGDSVVVDLDVAKANVSGAVNFDWQGDAMPIANGRYLINGNIEAYGQVLDISEGSIQFPKVPADQPYIRVMAEREIYGNTQVKRAGVLIDGPVRKPTIEAYTQPLTTEQRALTLLVTGSDFDYEQGVGAIDFGTYIAPRLFVSYGVGVFERDNVISARFDLARGFGIKASSGSKESGIDLNYRFEN